MKTSGRGGAADAILFVAPALIFLAIWIYLEGGPGDVLKTLDQWVLRHASEVATWIRQAVS
jgi:hypothetical protein